MQQTSARSLPGDPSPDGKGTLEIVRGIEVGHISSWARSTRKNEGDVPDEAVTAASWRWGVWNRHHPHRGRRDRAEPRRARNRLPGADRAFHVAWFPFGYGKNAAVRDAADSIYRTLTDAGFEVLLDDRDEAAGRDVPLDMELIGNSHRIVVGERSLKED